MIDTARETNVPSFGQFGHQQERDPFASSLVVSKNYASAPHKDNDAQEWLYGIFGPIVEDTGELASRAMGFYGEKSEFFVIPYQVAVSVHLTLHFLS